LKQRPNVLCFVTDQHRFDHLGCNGNPQLRTPNIDRIAAAGVNFQRSYVVNPLCMPARASLFTGRTPRSLGVRTNGIPLAQDIPTLPQALRDAGYATYAAGKLHLQSIRLPAGTTAATADPLRHAESAELWNSGRVQALPSPYYGIGEADFVSGHTGFVYGNYVHWLEQQQPGARKLLAPPGRREDYTAEQWYSLVYEMAIPQELHYNRWIADRCCDFLDRQSRSGQPFFAWCSFPDPHHPYAAPQPWAGRYRPEDILLPTARRPGEFDELPPFLRTIHDHGAPVVSGLHGPSRTTDDMLRRIIAMTYGMVGFLDQEIGRVLDHLQARGLEDDTLVVFMADHGLVRKGPFQFEGLLRVPTLWRVPGQPGGHATQALASQLDFAPTVLDFCGVPIPEGPVPAVVEAPAQLPPWPGHSLRPVLEGRAEAVREHVIVENDEDYLGLRVRTFITARHKLTVYAGRPWGELFDLQQDPLELHNLWDRPEAAPLKEWLRSQLLDAYLLEDSALPRRMGHA
jgi:arylsulfatase A-like enzyme